MVAITIYFDSKSLAHSLKDFQNAFLLYFLKRANGIEVVGLASTFFQITVLSFPTVRRTWGQGGESSI